MNNENPKIIPDFKQWAQSCLALEGRDKQINCMIEALKDAFFMGSFREPLSDAFLEKHIKELFPTEVKSRIAYEKGFRDCEMRLLK